MSLQDKYYHDIYRDLPKDPICNMGRERHHWLLRPFTSSSVLDFDTCISEYTQSVLQLLSWKSQSAWQVLHHMPLEIDALVHRVSATFQDWRHLLKRIHWVEKKGIFSEESAGPFAGQAGLVGPRLFLLLAKLNMFFNHYVIFLSIPEAAICKTHQACRFFLVYLQAFSQLLWPLLFISPFTVQEETLVPAVYHTQRLDTVGDPR